MPKDFSRPRRVAEQIQRELAMLIQREINDPRVGMVTVSAVEVTRDLSLAKVFITVLDDSQDIKVTLAALEHAAGFLRHELGQRMKMRTVPSLRFKHDESIRRGAELSHLIDEAIAKDKH